MKIKRNQLDLSAKSQRSRIITRLRQGPASTFQLRHTLDVAAPAPRIFELRHNYGYNIQTFTVVDINPGGGNHKVAQYVLLPGTFKNPKSKEEQ